MVDVQLRGDQCAVHGTGSTVGEEREVPRVVTLRDRDLLDRADHAGDRDTNDAVGQCVRIDPAEIRRETFQRRTGERFVQRQGRGELRLAPEPAENQVGIRDRRFGAASPVCDGSRICAGAARPYRQCLASVEPRDAAAARPDGDDLHLWRAVRIARDHLFGGQRRAKPFDQAHVGARTAHVTGDQVPGAEAMAQFDRRRHAAGGPGKHRLHREATRTFGAHYTAVGGHQKYGTGEPP